MICLLLAAVSCMLVSDGPMPSPDATYEQMRANAGRDAEAQVKLALWCEAHGLEKERLRHLAVATLADPSNALARGLLGVVEFNGKWKRPEAVARDLKTDMARADLLAEYNGRRAKAPVTVAAQYKLALWCEEKGLKDESRAHLATVVRLDPNHADAWKRLGYKKVGGLWTTDAKAAAQKVEHTAQQEADKRWKPRLEHLRDALSHKGVKKDEAERELATVTDPRAVPMVWKVFVQGHEKHHLTAVQLLGQIDAAAASRALATLALTGKTDEVRRRATETLKRRDPREWADLVISLIREKIRYQVKPVGGPNSPGVLFVEAPRVNTQRIYRPDDPTQILPGDQIRFDNQGRPILVRPVGPLVSSGFGSPALTAFSSLTGLPGYASETMLAELQAQANQPLNSPPAVVSQLDKAFANTSLAGRGAAVTQMLGSQIQANNSNALNYVLGSQISLMNQMSGAGPIRTTTVMSATSQPTLNVPFDQLRRDAQASAQAASNQLKADVASLDTLNQEISRSNQSAVLILSAATGQSFGDDRKAWEKWFVNQIGYAFMTPDDDKPTVVENVPIGYQPTAIPIPGLQLVAVRQMSCFGKGTAVRTIGGARPIESLSVGDLVLTQDTKTGKLGYRPILFVHRNPPSPTFRVDIDGQPVVASHFHRFWVAGRGWVMARDLKVGDPIRTLGDVAKVTAIEAEKVQLVFNLDVADDADFFVGTVGALVHDNTLPDLRLAPFDAPSVAAVR
jgi:hypothetical protein